MAGDTLGGLSTATNTFDLVKGTFQSAWDVATAKSTQFTDGINNAITLAGSPPTMAPAQLAFTPNVIEPPVDIPTTAVGPNTQIFETIWHSVVNDLVDKFSGFITTYFPDDSQYLQATEAWLVKAINEGGTGIPAHIEDQIWQRDRARILGEALRAEDDALSSWAARRFPLPPGQATYQVFNLRQDAQNKIANASRDTAVKQIEIEIGNIKHATEQSVKLYSAAMTAAGEYIKALATGSDIGVRFATSITEAQAKLISSAADYYRARISVEELKLKAIQPNAEYDQASRVQNLASVNTNIHEKVGAAVAAAQALGTQAAAALNGLHGSAGVTGSFSTTQDITV
jgi:hypothetical protein